MMFVYRNCLFALLLLWAGASAAASPVPRMSVKALVKYYVGEAGKSPWEQSAMATMQIEFATGYLAGVADGAQGSHWCDTARVKTGEIDADVIYQLKKLPPAEQNLPAAPAIVAILARKFPCKRP